MTVSLAAGLAGAAENKDARLERLITWMSGQFSSREQAAADADYHRIRIACTPIWKDRPGRWLYVEQATEATLASPYRQRVYEVVRTGPNSYESRVYLLPDPAKFVGAWKEPAKLDSLKLEDLVSRKGCTVRMSYKDDGTFIGSTTGRECPSERKGASYATSEVQITEKGMTTWDRGFNSEGKQVWGAEKGPYRFKRQ
jgi:hypothetical protein